MANLRVTTLSENKLVLSTPSLQEITKGNIVAIFFVFGLVFQGGLLFKGVEYLSLVSSSNQGHLDELTCERQEKHFVHCKLDRTDVNGRKATLFSTPIKSATSSVVTTSSEDEDGNTTYTHTCYISFVKRDGQQINNIELFTNTERSSDCPATKQIVKQINQYILGKGDSPLTWQKDTRVGDLTKTYKSPWQDNLAISLVFFISFMVSLPPIFGLVFEPEESWEFDKQLKKGKRKYRSRISQGEEQFSTSYPQKLEYDHKSITVTYKISDRSKYIVLLFASQKQRDKAKRFLEKATGLTAKESYD